MYKKYDESSIDVLEGLDAVRKKPGMYMGERGNPMVNQCVFEIVDNSLDEFLAGRNKSIQVFMDLNANEYTIADAGAGIPVGINAKYKMSTLTLIFTKLHAGGKFNNASYATSRGTHGVGSSAVNAISEFFEVWTYRDGWHYQKFCKGKPASDVKKATPKLKFLPKVKSGTIVRFKPDQSIVSLDKGKTLAKAEPAVIADRCRNYAMLNPGVTITLTVIGKTTKSKTFFYKDHKEVVTQALSSVTAEAMGKPFVYNSETLTCVLQWSSYSEDDGLKAYVCSGHTRDGGTHELGLRNALSKVVNEFNVGKRAKKVTPKELYYGLLGILNLKMSEPEFSSQTKDRLTSNVSKEVEAELVAPLREFFSKNKSLAKAIINKACEIRKSKEEFQKTLSAIANAKKKSKSIYLPGKLTACPKCAPGKRELYLLEGDSALGSAKKARDSSYQEVMALSGKIANAAKMTPAKLLESVAVQNILAAIGYNFDSHRKEGVEADKRLRINKIFLLPDADVDGGHISVLILTLLYKLLPMMFDEGRVFVVDAKLFSAYYRGKRYFGDSHNDVAKQLPKGAPKNIITRSKGWGELGFDTLSEIAFKDSTRQIIQLKPIKGKEAKYFESLVGSDSAVRKTLLGIE